MRLPAALIQPMAADDVAAAICDVTLAAPALGTVEIGGPEALSFEDFVARALRTVGDQRVVVADPEALYFGALLDERTLLPGAGARLGATGLDDWLARQA